jgi:hypothetical protein
LSGLEIDHELEFGRLLDWKVVGVCTAHDLVDIGKKGGSFERVQRCRLLFQARVLIPMAAKDRAGL